MGEIIQVLHSRSHSVVRWWGSVSSAEGLRVRVGGRSSENRIGSFSTLLPRCVFSAACYLVLFFILSLRLSAPGVKAG